MVHNPPPIVGSARVSDTQLGWTDLVNIPISNREAMMAEEHAKAIAAARAKLVKQRRNLVTDLKKNHAKGRT